MPFNVDPNAIYPISTVVVIVMFALIGLKIFPTHRDFLELEAKIAEKYVLKEDIEKKLDEFKNDTRQALGEIKDDIKRLSDKLDFFKEKNS